MAEKTQEETQQEIEEQHKKEQRIIDLRLQLSSSYSPDGDWKIAKIQEARLIGEADPYDINELHQRRQAIRDEINQLQSELGEKE